MAERLGNSALSASMKVVVEAAKPVVTDQASYLQVAVKHFHLNKKRHASFSALQKSAVIRVLSTLLISTTRIRKLGKSL